MINQLEINIKKSYSSWTIIELLIIFRFIFTSGDNKEISQLHNKLLVLHSIVNQERPLEVKNIFQINKKIDDWTNFKEKNTCKLNDYERFYFNDFKENKLKYNKIIDTFEFVLSKNFFYSPYRGDYGGVKEGSAKILHHLARERDWRIVSAKKQQALLKKGSLECEICKFDFKDQYGMRGYNFAEIHHIKPISDYDDSTKTSLKDLAVLCSNCHRMIHRKEPWLDIEDLKRIIKEKKVA